MRKFLNFFYACSLIITSVLWSTSHIHAQISVVSGGIPPVDLIKNVFLGEGVEITSVQYNGSSDAVGYFGNGLKDVQIDKGLVMSSGKAISAATANTSTSTSGQTSGNSVPDPDLVALTNGGNVNDVSQYIIKFKPNADTLRFKYAFASEEYPEFTCTGFNDVFGFFISGPGINGPFSNNAINIALVPDPMDPKGLTFTNIPVAINNVHNGNPFNASCTPQYPMYYNDKTGSTTITYDAVLNVFIAQVIVTPCEEYTIKLAIADKGDSSYDSAVFLEAKSFGTGAVRVTTITTSLDGAIAEGCDKGYFKLKLPKKAPKDTTINYEVIDDPSLATNGTDYTFIAPNQIIQAGDSELVFIIEAFEDGLAEATEPIAIAVQRDFCNLDTFYLYIKDNVLKPPVLPPLSQICETDSVLVDGTLPIQLPAESIFENNIVLNIPDPDTPGGQGIPVFSDIMVNGVIPTTLGPGMISKVCLNVMHSWIDDIDIFLVSPGGQFMELTTDNGRNGKNYTSTCFVPTATQPINYGDPFGAPAIYAPFTGDFMPEGDWNYLYQGGANPTNGVWKLLLIDDTFGIGGKLLNWSITFKPIYEINYAWTPGNLTSCATCAETNLKPSTSQQFILNVTDSYGCVVSEKTQVDVIDKIPAPDVKCGTLTANSIDFTWTADPAATGGYLISFNGVNWLAPLPGPTNHTVLGLSLNETVTMYVKIAGLCDGYIDTVVCQTPNCVPPTVNVESISNAKCFGSQDGSIDLSATGQYPPFTFDNGTTQNANGVFTGMAAGTYSVAVIDAQGCPATYVFDITQPADIITTGILTDSISCKGLSDGKASATVQGGTMPYSFLWSNGSTDSIATNVPLGPAQVTITDQNGCQKTTSVTMLEPEAISAATSTVNPKCFNGSDGSISVTPNGGTAPYTYLWDNNAGNQTTQTATALAEGTYHVTITDKNGCTQTSQASISAPTAVTLSVTAKNATCFGVSDGSATAIADGGTTPYTYIWDDPLAQTGFQATNLAAGTYHVTVTDGAGCIATAEVVISSPPELNATVTVTPTLCFGSSDGTASVNTFGGKAPYTYIWSDNGAKVATRNDLAAGTYSVTITDANGCTAVKDNIVISSPNTASIQLTGTDVLCFGGKSGTATATANGGNGGWTYLWNDPLNQDLPTASFLTAGTYSVTATDISGCTITSSITIGEPAELTAAPTTKDVTCFGGSDGSISINASGGTGNYSYTWNPGNVSGPSPTGLAAGNYTVTVSDQNNCQKIFDITINQPEAIDIEFQVGNVSCSGVFNGVATAIVNGGTAPYTYKWSDPQGQTTQTVTGLAAGTYTVTVTDAGGCSQTAIFDISQPAAIIVDLIAIDVTCYGGSNGSVGSTAYGGTTPYTFIWSNGSNINVANNLTAGIYSLTVTDAMGCSVTKEIEVKQPEDMVILPTITGINCPGDKTGSITVSVSGGLQPYSGKWSNGDTGFTASNLGAGTYTLQLTDSKGCLKTASYTISPVDTLDLNFIVTNVSCFGFADGIIEAQPDGGTPGYKYSWSTGASSQIVTGLAPGTYSLTITDSKSCTYSESIPVVEPDAALTAIVVGNDIDCFGEKTGEVIFTAQGGTPPLYYSIDGNNFSPNSIAIGLGSGSYSCKVKDKNGCTVDAGIAVVTEPPPFSVTLGPDIHIKLRRDTQLNAVVTNGIGVLNYKWIVYDTTLLSCQNCPNPKLPALTDPVLFKLVVTDENGCTAYDDIVVYVDKTRYVFVPTAFTPNADNVNDVLLTHGEEDAFVEEFRIFDSWGEMVYEAKEFYLGDKNVFWDGKFRNKDMNPGTFVWYMRIKFIDGDVELLKGSFDLLR
ncbi:MAG: choice-of-anchor L domain-containing protein [Saprospiraceae bacterium]|nr:choice-of-anchor L domain-containing protein [Saprospiraceae bacterium]